jgi:hypothetical protein
LLETLAFAQSSFAKALTLNTLAHPSSTRVVRAALFTKMKSGLIAVALAGAVAALPTNNPWENTVLPTTTTTTEGWKDV